MEGLLLNTRQVAAAIWTILFVMGALAAPSVRQSVWSFVKCLGKWKVFAPLLLMGGYTAAAVYLLALGDAWRIEQVVDTALWFVFSAAVLFVEIVAGDGDTRILPRVLANSARVVIVVEFLVAFNTFALWIELLMIPSIVLLTLFVAVAETKKEYTHVHTALLTVQAGVGLVIMTAAGVAAMRHWSDVATIASLRQIIMAPALSLALVPFLWGVGLLSSYEMLFLRQTFGPPKMWRTRWYFRLRLLLHCRFSRRRVRELLQHHPLDIMHARDRSAIDRLVRSDQLRVRRGGVPDSDCRV